jgi:type VI secretion system protein ImpG
VHLQEELLRYYNEELTYLRGMGREYARKYPKIADRLELQDGYPADPHVERLIESFALLTGRIRHEMDAEFPEITSALLGVLYPQLQQPVPPLAMARFEIDPQRGKFTTGHLIPKNTSLFAYGSRGTTCRFRTAYSVTMWPLEISEAAVEPPARYDFLGSDSRITGVIRLRISALAGTLDELTLEDLRIYLDHRNGPAYRIYELLFSALSGIMLLPEGATDPVLLPNTALSAAGFAPEEDLLPYPPNAHPAYRQIQEYFQFPEKFLFIDVNHLSGHRSRRYFDLLLPVTQLPKEGLAVTNKMFVLGCTPIANLFSRTTEPIRIDQRQLYYRLVADARREHTTEIHSIQAVSSSMNPLDDTLAYEPFYSFRHAAGVNQPSAFWHGRRVLTQREDIPGTDIYLSFLDLNFNPAMPPAEVVFAHTLCSNRDLATEIPPGGRLHMEDVGPVTVTCYSRPTHPAYPPMGGQTAWHLISNLSLNQLSLGEDSASRDALCEILRLYCFGDQPAVLQQIRGIRAVSSRPATLRVGKDAWRGFCPGTEITVTLDETLYAGGGAFLFATVLRQFLGLYTSVNSFTQLVLRKLNREEEWMRWPPLAGRQPLL